MAAEAYSGDRFAAARGSASAAATGTQPHAPLQISAVDVHVGSPCRVVFGGFGALAVPGDSMFAKKCYLEENRDWFRRLMIREPRGGPTQCLNLVLPPADPTADVGLVIMEQARYYPPMSGGNLMCVVTALLETGVMPITGRATELTFDTPAGLVVATAECAGGRVKSVTVRNVPSFVAALDVPLEVDGLGTVVVDVAYGGMFYVLADAASCGLELTPERGGELAAMGERVKVAAQRQVSVVHPENPAIDKIESLLWSGPAKDPANQARNAVIVSTGAIDPERPETWKSSVDRSPCGTGTSAKLAVMRARGEIGLGEEFRHESILDLVWSGRVEEDASVGELAAVVPSVTGKAWISGYSNYVLAEDDPLPRGFSVTDIWAPEETSEPAASPSRR